MATSMHQPRSTIRPLASVVVLVVAILAGGLWLALGNDDEGVGSGADPYRNAVSDERVPTITVAVRDDGGQLVADVAYEASDRPIPLRATYAFLQTLDDETWSTAYTLHHGEIVEGVPEFFEDDAYGGPGPDTYQLPDLNAEDDYRICISFVVGHPATDATGCSAPFHSG